MIIIYFLLGIITVIEFSTFITYGKFVTKQITDEYMNLDESKLRLNLFNPSILNIDGIIFDPYSYIAEVPFSLFSKYHISGLGTIPRWSKLHKRINEYFVIARKNSK